MGWPGGDTNETGTPPVSPSACADSDVRAIFEAHGDFVWRALARSGVRDPDLRDATQEVFLVVARKLGERDGTSALTTWLFGIATRVAANYRRKAHRRREHLTDQVPDAPGDAGDGDPESGGARAAARVRLAALHAGLPPGQRGVVVMV
jgi:RNA polymerase sigma-70 factor (ECF subfamily)